MLSQTQCVNTRTILHLNQLVGMSSVQSLGNFCEKNDVEAVHLFKGELSQRLKVFIGDV